MKILKKSWAEKKKEENAKKSINSAIKSANPNFAKNLVEIFLGIFRNEMQ